MARNRKYRNEPRPYKEPYQNLSVQQAHDLNLEHYGECPACGEYGADAIGTKCEGGGVFNDRRA